MYMYYISRHSRWQTNQCIHAYPWSNNAQIKFLQNDFGTLITQRNYIYLHIDNYLIKNEDWITFINNLDNWPLISSSDIVSINELALTLKIISQCDVRQRAVSDTENYQSVWCQTTSWLWYWKLSVKCDVRQWAGSDTENYQSSVMSDNELALILKIISQCDVKDIMM